MLKVIKKMNYFEPWLTLEPTGIPYGKRFAGKSFLALGRILLLTGIIFLLHLSPRLPDRILVDLLAIFVLASTWELSASSLASALAFFAFAVLFVPPVSGLIATQFADILALLLFLITAIVTSQLASALRKHAEQANCRERETPLLPDFVCATNREEERERHLHLFVHAIIVKVFSPWRISESVLLLLSKLEEIQL